MDLAMQGRAFIDPFIHHLTIEKCVSLCASIYYSFNRLPTKLLHCVFALSK